MTTISSRVVGTATAVISRTQVESGESPLGIMIADAQQAAALKASNQGSDFYANESRRCACGSTD